MRMNRGRRLALRATIATLSLLVLAAGARHAVAAADPSPSQVIETLHAGMLAVMKDAGTLDFQQRADRLGPILDQAYDLDFMARKALGSAYDKLDAEQQKRWMTAFRSFMVANYAGRVRAYHQQSFELRGEEASTQETVLVKGRVVEPGADTIDLTYRLRKTTAGWRVIDVYLKGTVSELALRRSDFNAVLEREGFDGLMASVDKKIAALAAGGVK
jgi:phospholipid transport system substrate-binding protein